MSYVGTLLPMAVGSVDRLEEIPDRVRFVFEFDPAAALARADVAAIVAEPGAREVIAALADELREAGPMDREGFRAAAGRVRQRTGQKGRALFHPIRVAVTGLADGPELDLAVPAIDRGAALPVSAGLAAIVSCRDRVAAFAAATTVAS
jgi:hypothetical protein